MGLHAAILNQEPESVLFGNLPEQMSALTGWPVTTQDSNLDIAYLMGWAKRTPPRCRSFVPYQALLTALDKRSQARAFALARVPVPETVLLHSEDELRHLLRAAPERRWALKWPLGCGGLGHRLVTTATDFGPLTALWPRPLVVQEYIATSEPVVYRVHAAGGDLFSWTSRRYPSFMPALPWVSVALGAEQRQIDCPSESAQAAAAAALRATSLLDSFGCVDLLQASDGKWLVLEVNTDGIASFVLRDPRLPDLSDEINLRLRDALTHWAALNRRTSK
ncbi:hypothetical protein [Streptomyces wuyuanensis]|uniref:hypothetical protein n=1 Tax=Streptomyces wuyuanensis TaxID=1196353 RepID=UPI00343508EA